MTIMTIRIPDDVKEAFDKAYEGEDKDAVIAQLLQRAAEEKAKTRSSASNDLIERFRTLRRSMTPMTDAEIREAREELRREAGY